MSKTFLISDIHFNLKNANKEWLDIQKDYFNDFFIPLLEPNDSIIILGDLFDNRSTINILVLNEVLTIFKKLSEICQEIHCLPGNHDQYNKTDYGINSLVVLQDFKNIFVYNKPELINLNEQDFLLVPFFENKLEEKEFLKKFQSSTTIACMHTEINGFFYTRNIKVDNKNESSVYSKYKHVYSGHYHINQTQKNITYIGSPYQMDRNDIGNQKVLYYIEDCVEKTLLNNYSPEFKRIDIDENNLSEDFSEVVNNNFVDFYFTQEISAKINVYDFIKRFSGARNINIFIKDNEEKLEVVYNQSDKFSIIELSKKYLELVKNTDEKDKEKILKYLENKYKMLNI